MSIAGFYLGMAHDTFRRFSPYWHHRLLLRYSFEIIFWLTQAFILFYILYLVNAGEVRFYVFLACLLGVSIYQVIAKSIYQRLLEWMISLFVMIYQFCRKTIDILIVLPIKWFLYIKFRIITLIIGMLLLLAKVVFMPFKWILQLIYSLVPQKIQKKIHKLLKVYSIIKDTSIKWIKSMIFRER